MSVGPHVFGDDRLGLWLMPRDNPSEFTDKLRDRLPRITACPYPVTDVFLPRSAQPADMALVRDQSPFFAHLWTTPHGLEAKSFAAQTLLDIDRLKPGACELNIELPDDELSSYIRTCVSVIRAKRPALRLRINVVPFKGDHLPVDVWRSDANLFLIVQGNYLGNMAPSVSPSDALMDLLDAGIPLAKCSVMYGAHVAETVGAPRAPALPGWIRRRASIYQDDLLVDAGYA